MGLAVVCLLPVSLYLHEHDGVFLGWHRSFSSFMAAYSCVAVSSDRIALCLWTFVFILVGLPSLSTI